jgi:hypothetical protein
MDNGSSLLTPMRQISRYDLRVYGQHLDCNSQGLRITQTAGARSAGSARKGVFLKPAKCKFEQESINYLGIVVTKGTVRIDLTKQNGLAAWPRRLTSVKQVCSTLGVLGYQRPFIRGFTQLA